MEKPLVGKSVMILAASGLDEAEFINLQRVLSASGAKLSVVSTEAGLVHGWKDNSWGHYFTVDAPVADTLASDFDFLVLPDGERSADKLRQSPHTRRILNNFFDGKKPIAASGHGVSLLAVVGNKLADRKLSVPAQAKDDLAKSGALCCEEEITTDGNLLTCNGEPQAKSAFIDEIVKFFSARVVHNQKVA